MGKKVYLFLGKGSLFSKGRLFVVIKGAFFLAKERLFCFRCFCGGFGCIGGEPPFVCVR